MEGLPDERDAATEPSVDPQFVFSLLISVSLPPVSVVPLPWLGQVCTEHGGSSRRDDPIGPSVDPSVHFQSFQYCLFSPILVVSSRRLLRFARGMEGLPDVTFRLNPQSIPQLIFSPLISVSLPPVSVVPLPWLAQVCT
jgi:hypothetical protein